MKLQYLCCDSEGTTRFAFRKSDLHFEKIIFDYVKMIYPNATEAGCYTGESFGVYRFKADIAETYYHKAVPLLYDLEDAVENSLNTAKEINILSHHTVPIAAYFKRDSSAVRQFIQSFIGDHTWDKGDQYITCINGKSGGLYSTTLVLK